MCPVWLSLSKAKLKKKKKVKQTSGAPQYFTQRGHSFPFQKT